MTSDVVAIRDEDHEHVWSAWMVYDRYGHYRRCLAGGCHATQRRVALTGEVTGA